MVWTTALCLVALVAVLVLTNTTHWLHKQKPVSTIKSSTPAQQQSTSKDKDTAPSSSSENQSQNPTPTPGGDTKSDSPAPSSNTTLITPYGNFVSNHHPHLDG